MKEIYFVRHGQTEYNKLRIVQGSGVDSDLNEKGREQRDAFYTFYEKENFEVVFTSKLKRTHQTMKPFIDRGIPWEQWQELDEICWGIHEGKKGTLAMRDEYRKMIVEWGSGNFDYALPEAESANELATRVRRFVEHLHTRPEQKILVCSHGRTMLCLITIVKNEPLGNMKNYSHKNTALYKAILKNGQFEMILENDVQHLGEKKESGWL